MPSQQRPPNPTFWFIPGMLVCVLFLTALCLFFIHRQMNSEEERLHQIERFSLEQTQQLFRGEVEEKWQRAYRQFPEGVPEYQEMSAWDERLGEDVLGFCLDNSGMLLYPAYQIYSQQDSALGERSSPRSTASRAKELPEGLPAITLVLELGELSSHELERQAGLVDSLLQTLQSGLVPLNPVSLRWLERLQEQCRRRNDREAWLRRESRVLRLVRQTQFAEKFLARLNLLLRRNLYNMARAEMPAQYLTSDPSEEPVLVVCKFLQRPPLGLLGVAIHLDRVCQAVEDRVARASWLPADVKVRIQKESFIAASEKLVEKRILDPRAPQYIVQGHPRDFAAFHRRAWHKNLLYLATVLLSVSAFVLVLFFGNRALKEQERLSKLRTDFLTNVSHELKTPLTAIRLHAETLERTLSAPKASLAATVGTIIEEVDRLSLLISDVLEFTRLENDKKKFVWEAVDLVPVIRESVRLFSQQLDEAGFTVSLDLPETLVLQRADRDALKQTASNLISNSLKFSPLQKALNIRLSRNGKRAVWEIEDRGLGIEARDLPHVFEKFYRGSNLDPAISGTGLGLTLCKAFIEAHGGKVRVESSPGHGSRFTIELPAREQEEGSGP
jgi:signal transduction histidine kinase